MKCVRDDFRFVERSGYEVLKNNNNNNKILKIIILIK
jgi:hypothetical protein